MPDHGLSISDCIVIGGGPAGLSASLFLARYRRQVLTFHHNSPRNQYSHGVHGFLGHDGILPSELLARGRSEVTRYGGLIVEASVSEVKRLEEDLFQVTTGQGGTVRQTFQTRRLLLATGLKDSTPRCPGFLDFYGKTVHHCPDCDGFEVTGKRVVVLGSGKHVVGFVLKLLTWTDQLTLLTNTADDELSGKQVQRLSEQGIPTITDAISKLEGDFTTGKIQSVRFKSGRVLDCDALFFSLGTEPASDLHLQLDCDLDAATGLVRVDRNQQTSVQGIYAAGDLTPNSQLAIVAAAEGALAAIQIHKSLLSAEQTIED